MNKFLKCFFILILQFVVILSLFTRGNHSIRNKKIVVFSNNTVNNKINLFERNSLKSDKNNLIFTKRAFTGGMDIDGQVLYICRVRVNNETIPGKYSQNFNKCAITHQNQEIKYKRYQLLVDPNSGSYRWSPVRRPVRHLPPNIVVGGFGESGQFYYISQCRVQSQRMKRISEQIGKVYFDQSMKQWIATVPFSGHEIQCFDYSVLIMV